MSKESNKHELLSAYFDGELSPEDRLRAEQMLEESVDARRDIDGVAELSELVKSLPTEAAPAEILPAILRQAERETLLSMNAAPSAVTQGRPRSWLTVIAGIATTAAAVLVTVQLLPTMTSNPTASSIADSSPNPTVVADHQTRRLSDERSEFAEAGAPAVAFDDSSRNDPVAFGAIGRANLSTAESPAADEPLAAKMQSTRSPRRAAAPRPAETKTAGGLAGRETESTPERLGNGAAPSGAASNALSLSADALQNARQGDVLQFFSKSGTTVTTYLVTVVDVKQALNQMQVLLARNDIPAHILESEAETKEASASEGKRNVGNDDKFADESGPKKKEADKQTERLFAVYVETTPDRFTSALKELLQDKLLADLYPKPPVDELQIEVADLGQSRRQLFSRMKSTYRGEENSDAEGQRTGAKIPASEKSTPAARNSQSASLPPLRKSKPLVQTKPADVGKKKSPAAAPSKLGQPTDSEAKDSRNKRGDRLESVKRFADAARDQSPSFQLRVQLAPLPTTAELQKQQKSKNRGDVAGNADDIASRARQQNEFYYKRTKVEEGRAAPVRVLFVFREAPKEIAP